MTEAGGTVASRSFVSIGVAALTGMDEDAMAVAWIEEKIQAPKPVF